MRRWVPLVACLFAVTACRRSEPIESGADAADTTPPAATEAAGHDHVEDDSIPSRDAEVARDAGSHPQEVMDFVGVGPGDAVADVFAGGGYYTYLLSQRVGPRGKVYAQGFSPGLKARVERGDLKGAGNVTLVDSLSALPAEGLDAVLIVRGYHLFQDPAALFAELHRALKPGAEIGVVEVRLGKPTGHDMKTHRMGEQTVIGDFQRGGFEYLGDSPILRNPDDPHTDYMAGQRHLSDRMLLKFGEPAGAGTKP